MWVWIVTKTAIKVYDFLVIKLINVVINVNLPLSDVKTVNNNPASSFSQDYDSIIKLVETLNNLPMCLVAGHQNIKFHYIFALNRYPDGSNCIHILFLQVIMTK